MTSEIVEIPGIPGYGVTRGGNVFCCRPKNGKGNKRTAWRPIKPLYSTTGRHHQFGVHPKRLTIHRVVARTFLGPCPEGMEVCHLNGNSYDNRIENLAYGTHKENESHKKLHGTSSAGERNGNARLTAIDIVEIRKSLLAGKIGCARRLAARYGVSEATISNIRHRKRWSHVGGGEQASI